MIAPLTKDFYTPNEDIPELSIAIPGIASAYPELRYMGSKHRLLPWIFEVLGDLDFHTVLDPFVGSGCVAYLFKCMNKRVFASDFLAFPVSLARATVENNKHVLDGPTMKKLLVRTKNVPTFIERTFSGIFFSSGDLRFLDRISANIQDLDHPHKRALALAALIRSCLKKQPRGVFTVGGNRYDDGRRDLRLSIEEHFLEQVEAFNRIVFSNGQRHFVTQSDVFDLPARNMDLVYLDPPYVPRSDDNCYIKRYHFLEGFVSYWKGLNIMEESKVKKIEKRYTPFSYRKTAIDAFDRLFSRFRNSIIVLSYSSNGFPDLSVLQELLAKYRSTVRIYSKPHRYHFGTHSKVQRAKVEEFLLVGY